MQQIIAAVRGFDGALILQPDADSGAPEVAWGDSFFYYAPDGRVPRNTQPYATIVTKDYPDDTASHLGSGRWRLNIHVDRPTFVDLTSEDPRHLGLPRDFATPDAFIPHPVYGNLGWVAVVNPARRTTGRVLELLDAAHRVASTRETRRTGVGDAEGRPPEGPPLAW